MTTKLQLITDAIAAQTKAIEAQTKVNQQLAEEISILNERLAPCEFTGWNLTECISNLVAELEEKGV